MAADNDEQRIFNHDRLVAFLKGPEGRMILREQSNDALMHFLLRVGWSADEPRDVIEIQQDNAHLRELRRSDAIGQVRKRLDQLEAGFEMHKNLQAVQHKQNQEKLDRIMEAVALSGTERAEIKKDINDTKRVIIYAVGTLLIAALSYFLVTRGLPGTQL